MARCCRLVMFCALAALISVLSCFRSFAQDYMTNSGAVPIPGAGHNYVRDLAETVNPATGSVSIRVRIPMPPGRELNLPFGTAYDSSTLHITDGPTGPLWNAKSSWRRMQAGLTERRLDDKSSGNNCYYYAGFVFTDAEGVSSALGLMKPITLAGYCPLKTVLTGGNEIVKADVTSDWKIATADGTTYNFTKNPFIEDRNGNTINQSVCTYPYTSNPVTYTDTVGRTLLTIFPCVSNPPSPDTITVSGLGGNYQLNWTTPTINFTTAWINLNPTANYCNNAAVHPQGSLDPAVSSIQMPNGQSFQFTYDPQYGQITKISYPSGGWVKYTWGLNVASAEGNFYDTQGGPGTCSFVYDTPALQSRLVSFDGLTTALEQDYTYTTAWNASYVGWASKQTVVTTKDLIRGTQFQTIYTYVSSSTGDPTQPGTSGHVIDKQIAAEQTVVSKDTSGAVLRTENKTWYDVRKLQSDQITLDNGLTSQTTYTYGPGAQVTEKDEYDYGSGTPGSLLRKTIYNYQGFSNDLAIQQYFPT
jgi:hypothetical protein